MITYTAVDDPRPVSPKQLTFLGKLFAERGIAPESYVRPRSVTEASELITHLLALPKPSKGPSSASEATLVTEPGMYTLDGHIFKVTPKRYGKGFNVKRATPDSATHFEYYGSAYSIRGARKLTQDEAAAWGDVYGFCVCCGRLLTDPESIAAGIGPVCVTKYF